MKECIEIMNTNFELEGIITNYESLIYTRNFFECGTFELTINKKKINTEKLKVDNFLIVNKNDDDVLIIEKVIDTANSNAKTLTVSGTCIKGLTKRRIIATNGYDRVAETEAENIQKHYVRNHMVESYYDDLRTPERDIAWLEIAPSQNRGMRTVWQARLTNLHDELKHNAEDTGLGWKFTLDRNNKKFVFDSVEGVDRTVNQITNPTTHEMLSSMTHEELQEYTHKQLQGTIGHPYIIFSEKKKTLTNAKVMDDDINYKNVGYAAGKGENEDRLITILGNAEGFNRREVFIDLNNIEDPDELISEGQKQLDTYKQIQSIEGNVFEIPNMEYRKDWDLGDLVTIESDGIYEDKRITQVKEIHERNNTKIEVGFGDKIPSLAEQIKKLTTRPIN